MIERVDGLDFDFDATWTKVKWDDHDAHQRGIQKMQNTRAVDLIARRSNMLVLLEAKDFRHNPKDWHRITSRDLVDEVARKVRDTVAGMVGAARRRVDEGWDEWVDGLHRLPRLVVVLWLERPAEVINHRGRADEVQHFRDSLKAKLSWLTSDVMICSQLERVSLPGISARDAAHAH